MVGRSLHPDGAVPVLPELTFAGHADDSIVVEDPRTDGSGLLSVMGAWGKVIVRRVIRGEFIVRR